MLAIHYSNEKLYVVKLRDALERIAKLAAEENDASVVAEEAKRIAEEALARKNMPPGPLDHFYDDGIHTGHPYSEYLDLPMRVTDDYADPYKGPVKLYRDFWKLAKEARAYCKETGLPVVAADNRDTRRIGFATGCPASDPRYRVFSMAIVDVQLTGNRRPPEFEGLSQEDMIRLTHPWLMSGDTRHKVAEFFSTGQLPPLVSGGA